MTGILIGMTALLTRFLVTPVVLLAMASFFPGVVVSGLYTALIVAVILAVINVTLKPILILLTLPINLLTLGLFTFVINALLLLFVSSFVDGFSFSGFFAAFVTALVLSIANWLAHVLAD